METYRNNLTATLEAAAADGDVRRVRGVANTFKLMRSGRLIHPHAFDKQFKGGAVQVPLLAQHRQPTGFASIGRVERVTRDAQRGLVFEATLAKGVELADQAWSLIKQGALSGVSIGWTGSAKWARRGDVDLDQYVRAALDEAGADEALVFAQAELSEISLVDVGDDPGARLAARQQAELGELQREVAQLRRELAEIRQAGATPEVAALRAGLDEMFEAWLADFRAACFEIVESGELADLASETAGLLPAGDDDAGDDDADGGDLDELQARLTGVTS